MKQTYWKILKNLFKILVTLAAIYWVSGKISFSELKETLLNCNPIYLVVALCTYALSQVVASSRLNSFFKCIDLRLTERYNLRLYQLGLLYNFFLPGGIGGDGYKIYFLKKNFDVSGRKVLSAVFFDRLSGLWALGIVIGCLIIFMPRLAIPNALTIAAILIGTGTYYYFLRMFFSPFSKKFLVTHGKAILVQGLQSLTAVWILYAMNFDGKFSPYLLIFMLSSLVAIIPSIGGGLGLRESMIAFGAVYFNLDEHLAVLVSLLFYIISLLVASSGLYYFFRPQRLGVDKMPKPTDIEQELEKTTLEEN